jgi:hypothetical protein
MAYERRTGNTPLLSRGTTPLWSKSGTLKPAKQFVASKLKAKLAAEQGRTTPAWGGGQGYFKKPQARQSNERRRQTSPKKQQKIGMGVKESGGGGGGSGPFSEGFARGGQKSLETFTRDDIQKAVDDAVASALAQSKGPEQSTPNKALMRKQSVGFNKPTNMAKSPKRAAHARQQKVSNSSPQKLVPLLQQDTRGDGAGAPTAHEAHAMILSGSVIAVPSVMSTHCNFSWIAFYWSPFSCLCLLGDFRPGEIVGWD